MLTCGRLMAIKLFGDVLRKCPLALSSAAGYTQQQWDVLVTLRKRHKHKWCKKEISPLKLCSAYRTHSAGVRDKSHCLLGF